jgi:hypothetical protein
MRAVRTWLSGTKPRFIALAIALLALGTLALPRGQRVQGTRLLATSPGTSATATTHPATSERVSTSGGARKRADAQQPNAAVRVGAIPPRLRVQRPHLPPAGAPIHVAPPEPRAVTAADFAVGITPVPQSQRVARPAVVRGIYLNAWAAGSVRKRERLLALADRTEINSFVVDVKDATGFVSYPSTVPLAVEIGANRQPRIGDIRAFLDELKRHGIYPIARIVCFKDPVLAQARPDWGIHRTDGSLWRDQHGEIWVDAFNHHVWDYNVALAREAVALGFAEVQWDYVRFPDAPERFLRDAVFPAQAGRTKEQAVREYMLYSRKELADTGAPVTADIFGLTTSAKDDMGIGQFWPMMVDAVDVLQPMVYPSHYARGSYGIAYPNGSPYEIVKKALEDAEQRTRGVTGAATIRPWLQDFTLGPPHYGPEWVRAQMQAVYDVGIKEWILWNPGSNYTDSALKPEDGPAPSFPIPHYYLPRATAPGRAGRGSHGARSPGT